MGKLPEWAPGVIVSLLGIIFAAGGAYFLFDWRLTQLEQRQTGMALATANTRAIAVIRSELNSVSARTSDQQIQDWNRWRARNDAKNESQDEELENHEARIDRLELQR